VKIETPFPYSFELTIFIASSKVSTSIMQRTGPNISYLYISLSTLTLLKIVGPTKLPFS